jgi:DNA repair and recombination protein RAD52
MEHVEHGGLERKAAVAEQLDRYLGPEYISYRRGEGGRMLAYAEGHEVISLMNLIFGWDGWNSKVVSLVTDYAGDGNGGKWSVGVAATVRLTVQVGENGKTREVFREDIGYGTMENGPSRGKAMEKCRKEAVTDALKRAARQLGNATGGCLYNKDYLERVKKVKGPADRIDFVEEELFRKPINKRKRFMMAQERGQTQNQPPSPTSPWKERDEDDEFGDGDEEGMLAGMTWSEEVFTV